MGGNFGNTKGNFKRSKSNKDSRLYGRPGQIKRSGNKETYIGPDGRAVREIHYTDHGNAKNHTNPHEHIIRWNKDGTPSFKKKE